MIFANPFIYFIGLNCAWSLNCTLPSISNGNPIFVAKFAGNPSEFKISTSLFILFTSDFSVVYTKLDCFSKSQFIFSSSIICFIFSIASWFAFK